MKGSALAQLAWPNATSMAARDVVPPCLLVLTAFVWKKHFYMRGLTYRTTVVSLFRERLMKGIFYVGLLGSLDSLLRSTRLWRLRPFLACWMLWCVLRLTGTTRDDRGWSDSVTRSWLWRFIAKFFGTRIVLSEEWLQLSEEQRRKWYDRHYVRAPRVCFAETCLRLLMN